MKRLLTLKILLLLCFNISKAQQPIISSLDRKGGTVSTVVTINGSGFGNVVDDLVVMFGHTSAQVLKATENSITAVVPPGVNYAKVTVTNVKSNLTGYSPKYFMLSYSGSNFETSRFINREIPVGGPLSIFNDFLIADLNKDIRPDVVISHEFGTGIYTHQNTTTDQDILQTSLKISNVNTGTNYLASGDLNGDGKLDIIATRAGTPQDRLFVFINKSNDEGDITYSNSINLEVKGALNLQKVAIGDLDNDGKPDIAIADNTNDDITGKNNVIQIFRNTTSDIGSVSFSDPITLSLNTSEKLESAFENGSYSMEIADLNGDGYPELMTSPLLNENVLIWKNSSIPGKIKFDSYKIIPVNSQVIDIKAADINQDNKIDLIVSRSNNTAPYHVYIFLNESESRELSFSAKKEIVLNYRIYDLDVADMNGDGLLDIVYSTRDDYSPVTGFLINQSSQDLTFKQEIIESSAKQSEIKVNDVNMDGRPDVLVALTNGKLLVHLNKNCIFPKIDPSDDITLCEGSDHRLLATRGVNLNYQWMLNNEAITSGVNATFPSVLAVSESGNYQVKVTSDNETCEKISDPVNVSFITGTPPAKPTASNSGPYCEGESVTLNAQTSDNTAKFKWTGPNGFSSTDQNPVLEDFSSAKAGWYILEATNSEGCLSSRDTTLVEAEIIPSIQISGPEAICEGQDVTLEVAKYPGYSYKWKFNNSEELSQTSAAIKVNRIGTYQAFITKNACNNNSDAYQISSIALPVASFTIDDKMCLNDTLRPINDSQIPSVEKTVYYNWNFGDGNTHTSENPSHRYKSSGQFEVVLRVGYENTTCISEKRKSIEVIESTPFDIVASATEFCNGDSVKLSIEDDFASYKWFNGANTQSVFVSTAGEYSAKATNINGCTSSDKILINLFPAMDSLEIYTVDGDSAINLSDTLQLYATETFSIYDWSPGVSLDDSTKYNPIASPQMTTTYKLMVEDNYGCNASAEFTVYVKGEGFKLEAAKLFSPNGDMINDMWEIKDILNYDNQIAIFNRQGEKVYEANPYLNNWEAKQNGNELPEGVYYYVLKFKEINSTQTGSVLVVR